MDELFSKMNSKKKYLFDKSYAEELYLDYMASKQKQNLNEEILKNVVEGKRILLIAPGKSAEKEKNKIFQFLLQDKVLPISINFAFEEATLIFVSNMIRFRDLDKKYYKKCIVTSNIQADNVFCKVEYDDLLAPIENVCDNAGLMAIKLMIDMKAEEIILAGFDGYSYYSEDNYSAEQRVLITKPALAEEMNQNIARVLKQYSKKAKIRFLTESLYS